MTQIASSPIPKVIGYRESKTIWIGQYRCVVNRHVMLRNPHPFMPSKFL